MASMGVPSKLFQEVRGVDKGIRCETLMKMFDAFKVGPPTPKRQISGANNEVLL
jgi:hypothetical protein